MIVLFEPNHLNHMDIEQARLFGVDLYKQISGDAFTLIIDNKIIACGGIEQLWPGVGEAWLIMSEGALKYPVSVMRRAREIFPKMNTKYHRVQALVLYQFHKAMLFVERLGFRYEGLMQAYGPNKEDYMRYVILR